MVCLLVLVLLCACSTRGSSKDFNEPRSNFSVIDSKYPVAVELLEPVLGPDGQPIIVLGGPVRLIEARPGEDFRVEVDGWIVD